VRGVQKHNKNIFCKKSMSKTSPKKIDKNFDVSFSSFFGVLSRFRVISFRDWKYYLRVARACQATRQLRGRDCLYAIWPEDVARGGEGKKKGCAYPGTYLLFFAIFLKF
jgi:hypothetical protein